MLNKTLLVATAYIIAVVISIPFRPVAAIAAVGVLLVDFTITLIRHGEEHIRTNGDSPPPWWVILVSLVIWGCL